MSQAIIQTHTTNFASESHDVGTASAQSSTLNFVNQTYGLVRIATTGNIHLKFDVNPTATVEDFLLTTGESELFRFRSGDKVAFIKEGAACSVNITTLE